MCEPERGTGAGVPWRVLGFLAVVALADAVVPFIPAVTLTILATCAVGCEVLRRAYLYGRALRPAKLKEPAGSFNRALAYSRLREHAALPAPPLAIEGTIVGKEEPWRATVSAMAPARAVVPARRM